MTSREILDQVELEYEICDAELALALDVLDGEYESLRCLSPGDSSLIDDLWAAQARITSMGWGVAYVRRVQIRRRGPRYGITLHRHTCGWLSPEAETPTALDEIGEVS